MTTSGQEIRSAETAMNQPRNVTNTPTSTTPAATSTEPRIEIRPITVPGDKQTRHLATWFPPGFTASGDAAATKKWPLIVFLHGRGECGTEGVKQGAVGLVAAAQLAPHRWPAIIIAPQKQAGDAQWIQDEAYIMACIERTMKELPIDPQRIYLTGLSQGGAGTWAFGAKHTDMFAAIVPICGYGDPTGIAEKLVDTPIWAFHGTKDSVVPSKGTELMIEAVTLAQAAQAVRQSMQAIDSSGGSKDQPHDKLPAAAQANRTKMPEPKLTMLEGVDHNAWDPAYRTYGEELIKWMLSKTKPSATK